MNYPLSPKEHEYLKDIQQKCEECSLVQFSAEEIVIYSDIISLLCEKSILKSMGVNGSNSYLCIGSFDGFYKWLSDQEDKYSQVVETPTIKVNKKYDVCLK